MTMEVKICGLTNYDDAVAAYDAGADYLGFVLYSKSPRGITPAELEKIVSRLDSASRAIGVFVNVGPDFVKRTVADCGLYAAQMHGDEGAAGFENLGFPVWRALRVRSDAVQPQPQAWPADRYVVDAAAPGQYGGSGLLADRAAAVRLARELPVMLAGGLNAANVAEAIREVRPLGVDVSGGVESSPGKKDLSAVADFIRIAKAAVPD